MPDEPGERGISNEDLDPIAAALERAEAVLGSDADQPLATPSKSRKVAVAAATAFAALWIGSCLLVELAMYATLWWERGFWEFLSVQSEISWPITTRGLIGFTIRIAVLSPGLFVANWVIKQESRGAERAVRHGLWVAGAVAALSAAHLIGAWQALGALEEEKIQSFQSGYRHGYDAVLDSILVEEKDPSEALPPECTEEELWILFHGGDVDDSPCDHVDLRTFFAIEAPR